ncbi:MAG: DUF2793 domain-containing protein [Pseudomonadota bacterium]
MEQSPRLSLSYVMPAQAQKHVTVNESFRRLDALTQLAVLSRTVAAAPGAPAEGDAYILPASPTGSDWAGFSADNIAVFQDGAWIEITSVTGLRAWIADESALAAFNGAGWVVTGGGAAETALQFGVNTSADATNRLSVKSDAILFSHDDVTPGNDDCLVKVNKAATADTGSFLFQSNFSGRAEFGLIGNDDFTMKVSADGAVWNNAIIIDKDNGFVGIGDAPADPLHVFHDTGSIKHEVTTGGSFEIQPNSGGWYSLILNSGTGQAILDINPRSLNGTENTLFRFFRETNTSGDVRFDVMKGNGGTTTNHRFRGNDDVSTANFVCNNNGRFGVGEGSPSALLHVDGGGALFGNPTGGDKGTGTINAQAVYDDNALLSCYVFDQVLDGAIDIAKWDAKTPDRQVPAELEEIEDENGDAISREKRPARIEQRFHEPLRKFAARIGGDYDPLTLDGYARHWRERRHLSAMPNEAAFDPEHGLAAGEWIQRLVETAEIQAVLIEELNRRLKFVEQPRPFKRV